MHWTVDWALVAVIGLLVFAAFMLMWAEAEGKRRKEARWYTSCEECAVRWEGPDVDSVGQAYAQHYYRFHDKAGRL